MGKVAKMPDPPPMLSVMPDPWLQTIEKMAVANVPIDNIKAFMDMREKEHARVAERAYNASMAAAQAALEPIQRNKYNPQTKSGYTDLAALSAAIKVMNAHGFGVSCYEFDSKKQNCLGVACDVSHIGGHARHFEFNIPWDGQGIAGKPNKTHTHAWGSTFTYGRRYAISGICNLISEGVVSDDDGNAAGKVTEPVRTITDDQAEYILAEMKITKLSAEAFCKVFRIEALPDLPEGKFKDALAKFDERRLKMGLPKREPLKEEATDAA